MDGPDGVGDGLDVLGGRSTTASDEIDEAGFREFANVRCHRLGGFVVAAESVRQPCNGFPNAFLELLIDFFHTSIELLIKFLQSYRVFLTISFESKWYHFPEDMLKSRHCPLREHRVQF